MNKRMIVDLTDNSIVARNLTLSQAEELVLLYTLDYPNTKFSIEQEAPLL